MQEKYITRKGKIEETGNIGSKERHAVKRRAETQKKTGNQGQRTTGYW